MHFIELTYMDGAKAFVNMAQVVSIETSNSEHLTTIITNADTFEVKETARYILSCLPSQF